MNVFRQLVLHPLHILFVSLVGIGGWFVYSLHINEDLVALFLAVVIITLFPLYIHSVELLYKKFFPSRYEELYVQTVDMFLSLQSFDDVIKVVFDKVLQFIGVDWGILIFYSHASDDYTIYYQKYHKQKIIRKAHIDKHNIIFKIIQSADDILIKNKLDPSVHFQRTIIYEMEKLGAEIIVPIFYHDIFLGLMVIGRKKLVISKRDILMLKALASKIAIVAVNGFFVQETLKKKEIEKEYELGNKVLQQFLSPEEGYIHNFRYKVMKKQGSQVQYYFHIFSVDHRVTYICVCQLHAHLSLISLLIPMITGLLQSYARLAYDPGIIVQKIQHLLKIKNIIDIPLPLLVVKKTQNKIQIGYSETSPFACYKQYRSQFVKVDARKSVPIAQKSVIVIMSRDYDHLIDLKHSETENWEHTLATYSDFIMILDGKI